MGTSKGYIPPTGYLWSDSKRAVTNMVRSGFTPSSVGKAVSSFSKAMRDGRKSYSNSVGNIGAKSVNFIEAVRQYGFLEALEKVGLSHLRNLPAEKIRSGLLEYFNESGNDLYESVAQQSMSELMRELLMSAENEEDYNNIIGSIDTGEFIREFIIKFIQNCFFTNFAEKLMTMFNTLNKYDTAEESVKTYIRTTIESEFSIEDIQKVDWNGMQGRQIIEEKCNKAFEILSVWSEALV
ncbi:hypothetical protein SAMN05216169_10765 [Anoxybacillus pushchinoensis]|uniref:Uncharacterized protein n=1 Tax=Anoxybacillus pushchinoensis TaxID=150248 RepID=A0A1I0U378_9BACL|nr:hypothetical protein [Anoxybacillus pushchinoensis]SFA58561.1 hypothetical protein SAMN05216169_10765 [Anoxybacillus pushchinoensis]